MLIKKIDRNVTPLFSTALRLMRVALFFSVGLILLAQSSFAQGNPASQPKFIKLYVDNLSAETTEETLRNVFAEFGEIKSVKIEKDGDDNPIGYVEMEAGAAEEAIEQLNESELDGSEIVVRKAEPVKDRPQAPVKLSETAPQSSPKTEPKQKVTVVGREVTGLTVVTDDNFDEEVLKSDKVVVVFLWAESCATCLPMFHVVNSIQEEYDGKAKFVMLDVDKNQQIPQNYNIKGMPAFLFFKHGKMVGTTLGVVTKNSVNAMIDSLL